MKVETIRNHVAVIRFVKEHKEAGGVIVGVVESPPAGSEDVSYDDIVRLWVHRRGLPPEAAANFTAEYSPVVPWAALVAASKPPA